MKEENGNELTAEELARKEEAKKRRLANLKVFKPYSELTEEEREEQAKIVEKAKEGTKKYHEKQKNLKEQALALLNTRVTREQLEKMTGESSELVTDDDLTVTSALILSALREAIVNGNCKAMEFLMNASGQKPKEEVELSANVITEQDRRLLEKVASRKEVI